MATQEISTVQESTRLRVTRWAQIGITAAAGSIVVVLLAQAIILRLFPGLASFKPLDSYARTALFTLIPALAATGVFAWLVKAQERPVSKFLWISAGLLLLSFIPDFLLPLQGKTIPGSTAAAFLHLMAGIATVALILAGYTRSVRRG